MNKRISVKDKLPKMYQDVLCYTTDRHMVVARRHDYLGTAQFYCGAVKMRNVTHWMPLPDSPSDTICDSCALLEDMP